MYIDDDEAGLLMVCAIRYCHGRQTYMPRLIQGIVLSKLDKISDKDLGILLNDCKFQQELNNYGDPTIDKPNWLEYRAKIQEEYDRRKRNR